MRISCLRAEISTRYIPNTKHEFWSLSHNGCWTWDPPVVSNFFPPNSQLRLPISPSRQWLDRIHFNIAIRSWGALRIITLMKANGRSQWPRSLRHEISSPAQTLGSWVRIPLELWMSVRLSSVLVLSYVGSGLAIGLITCPRSPTSCL
jgi:hypothetical protein